ncbi:hypothetical protein Sa4125_27410 [Aureimonas sp. SA4125]|uniref:hypothetical protein n=1 Tax=Aureimonas sp. SA4125 TaxID=2826993 RepID=UPI001CC33364|nr:hypothetical protein [Aureimonas sp. SA4125]BDA85199.1 hypothetical protein Sa4125_27410 [Aureimonas sp. SA4125]
MSETVGSTDRYPLVTDVPPRAKQVKQGFGDSLLGAVRDNPASAALIGMGAAWLFFGGARTSIFGARSHGHDRPRHRREQDDDDMRFEAAQARYVDRFGGASRDPGNGGRGFVDSVEGSAQQAGSRVAENASSLAGGVARGYEAAASYASDATAYVGSTAHDASRAGSRMVRSQAGQIQQTVGDFFEDQPLALGVLGLALGAGVAALLPATDIEREYLGETSDAVKDQARAAAGEKLGEAKNLAGAALDEIAREAKAQGLTTEAAKDQAADLKDRFSQVASAAQTSVREEAGKVS